MTRHLLKFFILTALVLLPGSITYAAEHPTCVNYIDSAWFSDDSVSDWCDEIGDYDPTDQNDQRLLRLVNRFAPLTIVVRNKCDIFKGDSEVDQYCNELGSLVTNLDTPENQRRYASTAGILFERMLELASDPSDPLNLGDAREREIEDANTNLRLIDNYIVADGPVSQDPLKDISAACNFDFDDPIATGIMCLSNLAEPVFAWIVSVSTYLLNVAINVSVLQFKTLAEMEGITLMWTVLRDALNIVFIAALIWAGIGTVLGMKSVHWQSTVVNVIIAALLINFSMVFAKIIIDISNILSLTFYYGAAETGSTAAGGIPDIATQIVKALHFSVEAASAGAVATMIGAIGNILVNLLTAIVLFVAACMFIVRSVVLIFLLVLSPVAFMGSIMPFLKTYETQWWGELKKQCIIAPVYLFLFFATIKIITAKNAAGQSIKDVALSTGSAGAFIFYCLVLGMLIFALIAAQKVGAAGFKFATQTGGALAFGGTGWLGRKVLGTGGAALMRSEGLKAQAAQSGFRGAMARGVLYSGAAATKSTFDLRGRDSFKKLASTTGVGFGQASKSTFDKNREEREKKAVERSKLFAPQTDLEKEMVKAANKAFIEDPANQEKLQKLTKLVAAEEAKIKDSEEYKAKHGDKLSTKKSEVAAREAELDANMKRINDAVQAEDKKLATMRMGLKTGLRTQAEVDAQEKIVSDMKDSQKLAQEAKNTDKQLKDLKTEEADLRKKANKYLTEKLKGNKDYKEKEFMLARGIIDQEKIKGFSDDKEGKKAKDEYIKAQGDKEKKFVSGDYFKEQYAGVLAAGKAAVIPFTGEMPFGIPYVARSAREQAAAVRAKIGGKSKAQQLEDELKKKLKEEADEEAKEKAATEEKTKPSDA